MAWGGGESESMMATVATAIETLYAEPFPSHAVLCDYILHELPKRNGEITPSDAMEWWAELGVDNHARLHHIFDSKGDHAVVRAVGEEFHSVLGMQTMQAMFYVYFHFVNKRCVDLGLTFEQTRELLNTEAKVLGWKWDGVGEWRA